MPQFPWKPLRIGTNIDRQINDAFRDLIHNRWGMHDVTDRWQPEIDLLETADSYIIEADVPGVAREALRVLVDEHSITISGTRECRTVEHSMQGVRLERRHGSFSRQFILHHAVDPSSIEHVCSDGLHRIRLKKQTKGKNV